MSDYPTFDSMLEVPQAPLLESDVQESCVEWARRRGWWARKFSSPQNRAVVDYLFGKDTWVEFVEFKRPKAKGVQPGELSADQLEEHKKMRECGMTPVVFDDFEAFKKYMTDVEKVIALGYIQELAGTRRYLAKDHERHE